MTTKLEAINTMLSCVNHVPLNTLEGTLDSFTLAAVCVLDDEVKNFLAEGWNFNEEHGYTFYPDSEGVIRVPDNVYSAKFPSPFDNIFVIRAGKIYDKRKHTFTISKPLKATIVTLCPFEELPEAGKLYVQMSAAYKFTKRMLGSQTNCVYTSEDVQKARAVLLRDELFVGGYNFNSYRYMGQVRRIL